MKFESSLLQMYAVELLDCLSDNINWLTLDEFHDGMFSEHQRRYAAEKYEVLQQDFWRFWRGLDQEHRERFVRLVVGEEDLSARGPSARTR